jgi:tryptophan synthase alpha chain
MTLQRISDVFASGRAGNRAAFVGYVMAADPDLETSLKSLISLVDSGVDVIELGAPFTDPMADGPAVQKAGIRALRSGGSLTNTLDIARRFRLVNSRTPLIVMGYANPVHRMGYQVFARRAAESGVDGVITVDLPPEEDGALRVELAAESLACIRLATPTTTDSRMRIIADGASGFIYYVSVAGVTGAGIGSEEEIAAGVARVRKHSDLPIVIGFGVRTPEQAGRFARLADGVVVGSALVECMREAEEAGQPDIAPALVAQTARNLASAVHAARG